jgi:serine phosphatase RsbU (regulator of sigma subunit)
MVSVVCSNALNRAVREYGLVKPNLILDKVAKLVEETFAKSDLEVKDGMDISLCAYHPDQKLLEWSGANNPLYIVTPEKAQIDVDLEMVDETHLPNLFEIKADKQPIGMFSNRTPYTLHQIPLNEGDIFYSFTDGFADQFGGEKGKKYKTKKMKEFFRSIYDQPIAEQGNMIKKEFNDWRGRLEQIDDVCVIGVRV